MKVVKRGLFYSKKGKKKATLYESLFLHQRIKRLLFLLCGLFSGLFRCFLLCCFLLCGHV